MGHKLAQHSTAAHIITFSKETERQLISSLSIALPYHSVANHSHSHSHSAKKVSMVTYNQLMSRLPHAGDDSVNIKKIEPRKRGRPRKKPQVVNGAGAGAGVGVGAKDGPSTKKKRGGDAIANVTIHVDDDINTTRNVKIASCNKARKKDDKNVIVQYQYQEEVEEQEDGTILVKSLPGPGKPRSMPADDDLDRLEEICDALKLRQEHRKIRSYSQHSTVKEQINNENHSENNKFQEVPDEDGIMMSFYDQDQALFHGDPNEQSTIIRSRKRLCSTVPLDLDFSSVKFVSPPPSPIGKRNNFSSADLSSMDYQNEKNNRVNTEFDAYAAISQRFAELASNVNRMYAELNNSTDSEPSSSMIGVMNTGTGTLHSSDTSTHSSSSSSSTRLSLQSSSNESYAQSLLSLLLQNSNCSSITQRLLVPGTMKSSKSFQTSHDNKTMKIVDNLTSSDRSKPHKKVKTITRQNQDEGSSSQIEEINEPKNKNQGNLVSMVTEKYWKNECMSDHPVTFEEALGTFSSEAR